MRQKRQVKYTANGHALQFDSFLKLQVHYCRALQQAFVPSRTLGDSTPSRTQACTAFDRQCGTRQFRVHRCCLQSHRRSQTASGRSGVARACAPHEAGSFVAVAAVVSAVGGQEGPMWAETAGTTAATKRSCHRLAIAARAVGALAQRSLAARSRAASAAASCWRRSRVDHRRQSGLLVSNGQRPQRPVASPPRCL